MIKYEFNQRIKQAKQEISALLAGERTIEFTTHLQTATYIAARSQRTSEAAKAAEPVTRKERAQYNEKVKPTEEEALLTWAKENHLWIEENDFTAQFKSNYVDEGAEQKVYLKEDGIRARKVNTGHFHGTWLEFFIRLILHEAIFRSTAYTLVAFTEEQGQFCAVIEQPWVKVRSGANKKEVQEFLKPIGFVHTRFNDYYNRTEGIILEDLHDENVFIGEENNLLFVDPVIYLETPDLGLGGESLFRFPFATSF